MIKPILLLSVISLFSVAYANNESTEKTSFDMKTEVQSAKEITKAFGGALKTELVAAMKASGPLNALDVCNQKALVITGQVAIDKKVQISRVSLKNRNPVNVPNEWQTTILKDFDQRAAKGENIATMAHAEVIETKGKKQLHFMKALPTGKVCLACHGSELSKEVAAKISTLYPNDKAIGYSENQVRGAIVVVKDIKD